MNSRTVATMGGPIQNHCRVKMALRSRAHWIMFPKDMRLAGESPRTAKLDSDAIAARVAFMKFDSDQVKA